MNDVEEYPNQKYGWVKENDGSWSLYAPDGTKVIGTTGNTVQVPTPVGTTDAVTKAYADAAGGGGGGSMPLVGFSASWVYFPTPLTLTDGSLWSSTQDVPDSVDWDTDGFADPGALPTFSPQIPADLGGVYLATLKAQFKSATAGGYVAGNIGGSNQGWGWTPCPFSDDTIRAFMTFSDQFELSGGSNDLDIAHFINFSGHDVLLVRMEWWLTRLGPLPVAP